MLIVGLSSRLPAALEHAPVTPGVLRATASRIAHLLSNALGTAFTCARLLAAVAPLLRGGKCHLRDEEGRAADRAAPAPADPAGRPARVPATGES